MSEQTKIEDGGPKFTRGQRTPMKSIRDQCDKCKHFAGIGSNPKGERLHHRKLEDIDTKPNGRGTCAAGVNYNDVIKSGRRSIALPCFKPEPDNMPTDGVWPTCPSQSFKTPTELDAEAEEIDASSRKFIQRVSVVRPAILKHANWQSKVLTDDEFYGLKPAYPGVKDARGSFPCPICKSGELHYSISAMNGHVHARCTTTDCVSWME